MNYAKKVWSRVPQTSRYVIVISLSLVVSLAGVWWGIWYQKPQHGGRGGALAAMVSLWAMFLRPDYGLRIFDERKGLMPAGLLPVESLREELDALVAGIRINSGGQARQNRALVIASIIGTIFWGFGDLLAEYLPRLWR